MKTVILKLKEFLEYLEEGKKGNEKMTMRDSDNKEELQQIIGEIILEELEKFQKTFPASYKLLIEKTTKEVKENLNKYLDNEIKNIAECLKEHQNQSVVGWLNCLTDLKTKLNNGEFNEK